MIKVDVRGDIQKDAHNNKLVGSNNEAQKNKRDNCRNKEYVLYTIPIKQSVLIDSQQNKLIEWTSRDSPFR